MSRVTQDNQVLRGISASRGTTIGTVYVHRPVEIEISTQPIAEGREEAEFERFLDGRTRTVAQLQAIYETSIATLGEEEAEIFEGHIELVGDEEIEEAIRDRIIRDRYNAERAASEVIEANAREMEELENDYMRERAADLRDIGRRLVACVAGREATPFQDLPHDAIIFAPDLTPSDTAQMDTSRVAGFVTETGGPTSHVAIMARTLELPAIVGCTGATAHVTDGETVILEASSGEVILSPSEQQRDGARRRIADQHAEREEIARLRELPAVTSDGRRVELAANIGTDRDAPAALEHGAEGVGLYRSEFLFMDTPRMPSEDAQYAAYKRVAEAFGDHGVTVRTLDVGGDKGLDYLTFPKELNPFLGWRAIRMCFDTPGLLETQLRAILRASHFGKLRIMFPMVISVEEFRRLKDLVADQQARLRTQGVPFDERIEVGVMVETPAAAMVAEHLAKEVDFFSIGTNDLTQYTLAVDRGNERIASLYNPLHPAVLKLIARVIDASHAHGKWTAMCGELAGDERATTVLLGMGLDEFSMSPSSIGRVKRIIREASFEEAIKTAQRVLSCATIAEVESHLPSA